MINRNVSKQYKLSLWLLALILFIQNEAVAFCKEGSFRNFYTFNSIKKVFNTPVELLWPAFMKVDDWYSEYKLVLQEGPAYIGKGMQEGQILKVFSVNDSSSVNPRKFYRQHNIVVDKPREVIVSLTLSDYPDWDLEIHSLYYHWRFSPVEGGTSVVVDRFAHFGQCVSGSEEDSQKAIDSIFQLSWSTAFKQLAEDLK